MRIYSLILIAFLALSSQAYGQWNDFDIYYNPGQWYQNSKNYAKEANFKKFMVLTQGGIIPGGGNDTTVALAKIQRYVDKHYPDVESEGIVVLDWEIGIFDWLKHYPENHPKFKYAEAQFLILINEFRKLRPNLKLSIYGLPFRGYNEWQKTNYNKPGSFDNIMSKVDFISPSLYIGYSDEERGREFNIQYLKDMMDAAMIYGKRHNKPVMPFIWHRIIRSNKIYPRGILQREAFADYIKIIKDYSNDGFKTSGVFLWDDGSSPRINHLDGVANWLKGKVKDEATYDALCVSFMKGVVNRLNNKRVDQD